MMTFRFSASAMVGSLAVLALATVPSAQAQRAAPITQGVTSGENSVLRQQTASMQVEINNLKADKASLSGKIETQEFLLSQTRDDLERLQNDDREIAKLIEALEKRLADQDAKIATLEAQLTEVAASPTAGSFTASSATTDAGGAALNIGTPGDETNAAAVTTRSAPVNASGDSPRQTGSLGTLPASSLPGEAGPLFAAAKSKLLQFDYAGAEDAFRAFLDRFGDDQQAGEAQYWLGEVLYQQEAYSESGAAYTDMIRTYPDDPRAPDALVKLARSMRLVGEPAAACSALNQLPRRYPEASGVTKNLAAVERARSACDT